MLHAKRRIELPLPFAEWLRRAAAPSIVRVMPLDAEVVIALNSLPDRFHGDPADRLIVATARVHRLSLATHDERIRRSRAVRTWRAPSGRGTTKSRAPAPEMLHVSEQKWSAPIRSPSRVSPHPPQR